ncbi:MAG: AI-2E family transporter [Saprospiraceae bacterium]|nr:AI-2E family transporter [Saprospiraceae bacterium]
MGDAKFYLVSYSCFVCFWHRTTPGSLPHFPLAVGKRLKINTLVVFIMIISGGMLWGAAGMILFIPMISIVKLVADNTPSLRYLSELLELIITEINIIFQCTNRLFKPLFNI